MLAIVTFGLVLLCAVLTASRGGQLVFLAVLAAMVTKLGRRPAVSHALWLLVVLKLLTPPLVVIPVDWPQAAAEPLSVTGDAWEQPTADSERQRRLVLLGAAQGDIGSHPRASHSA